MEIIRTAPVASSFTPLAEHQSRTPASFYDHPPVLHYHSARCKVVVLESELVASAALNALRGPAAASNENQNQDRDQVNGGTGEQRAEEASAEKEIVLDDVDVWVTSDKFLLFRNSVNAGISIAYPSISLHAIQRLRLPGGTEEEVQGLYMQIANPPGDAAEQEEDEDEASITLTVIPPPDSVASGTQGTQERADREDTTPTTGPTDGSREEEKTPTQALFEAVSACANLHPDPVEDDEDAEMENEGSGMWLPGSNDGGLPPPVDGSSGWITAENMHEFFDSEGNWIGGGDPPPSLPLGPGAGTVRRRDETDDGPGANEQGDGEGEVEETKWRRIE